MSRTLNYEKILQGFRDESRLRSIPADRSESDVLDLCSNDYMGLRHLMPEMRKEFDTRFPDVSFSASASRLLSIDQNIHKQLEDRLAELYGRPALLFNSGYHANTGIVSSLNIPGTLFVADKLVHASMIDGLTQGRCNFKRFKHNDVRALSTILEHEASNYSQIVVMVESIYSMDGDIAPLREIAALRDRYDNVLLYVDEAHAFGVRGRQGLGLCDELGLYVIDRANINAPDRRDDRRVGGTPSNDPALADEYLERVKAMYYRSRNHTCVVAFALGGESGNGYNMYKAYEWLKSVEKSRPVIYTDADGEWNSDL